MARPDASLLSTPPDHAGRLSRAIAVARVICIMGIVYVHAWTGRNGHDLQLLDHTPQGMLRWALIELMGRSSVPLLSMISGWLVAPSLERRGWRRFLAGKLRTVLAPMVVWNALAIVFVSGAARAGWIYGPQPTTWWWTIDELFCLITPDDINVQLPFLRDLFVCLMAAVVLVRLPDRVLGVMAGLALVWSLAAVNLYVLQRPSILAFFILGMLARRHDLAAFMASRPLVLMASPYVVMAGLRIWLEAVGIDAGVNNPTLLAGVDLVMRLATALFFWAIAWRVADSRAAAALLRIEPFMFLMFCSHLIVIWLAGPLIGGVTGRMGSPAYPVYLLVQPLLWLAVAVVMGRVLLAIAPAAARMLSGGRLSAARRPPPQAMTAAAH